MGSFVTTQAGRPLPHTHPWVCACGTRFGLRATLPQDSVASCSGLPPLV